MAERDVVEPEAAQQPKSKPKQVSVVSRLAAAWRQGWHVARQTWLEYPASAQTSASDITPSSWAPLLWLRRSLASARKWSGTPVVRRRLLVTLALFIVVIGTC